MRKKKKKKKEICHCYLYCHDDAWKNEFDEDHEMIARAAGILHTLIESCISFLLGGITAQ